MSQFSKVVAAQRAYFMQGATRPLEKRKEVIRQLKKMLDENVEAFGVAYQQDHGRDKTVCQYEIAPTGERITHQLDNVDNWVKTVDLPVSAPLNKANGDHLVLVKEPLGVVLNIAPWNGPVSSIVSNVFDHIFYTGSTMVAKIIMTAAAKHLTPVTLELGGKNPVFVDDTADIKLTVSKLLFAKSLGAAQICICPDYVLATPGVKTKLVAELKTQIAALPDMSKNPMFGKIVHDRAYKRLADFLKNSKGSVIARSGEPNPKERFFPITVVDVKEDDSLMEEELFGPILPICEVKSIDYALQFVLAKEKPLALYVFSNDGNTIKKVVATTSSGGVTVNDVFAHCNTVEAPFGGVGHSGMGRIVGKYGFDTFTHEKPVVYKENGFTF